MERQQSDSRDESSSLVDEETVLEAKIRSDLEGLRASFESWHAGTEGSYWTFDEYVDEQVRFAIADYHKSREKELGFSVPREQITAGDVKRLESLLDRSDREQDVHDFFEDHPKFLVHVLAGGHGRYQISKKRLGSQFVTDFLIAEQDSHGMHWYAVELENPRLKVFRDSDGRPTKHVHHALDQIRDWRDWLKNNLSYARNPLAQHGLGLLGIDPNLSGLILIGRRQEFPEPYKTFCLEQKEKNRVLIHSYDWLVQQAQSSNGGGLVFRLREEDFRPSWW